MTRVIVVSDEFYPHFSELAAYVHHSVLSLQESEVTLIVPDAVGEHYPVGEAHIVRIPKGIFGYKTGAIAQIVQEHDVAYIHTTGPLAKAVAKQCAKQNKKIKWFVHDSQYHSLFNYADVVYVPVKQAKEVLIQQGLVKRVVVEPYDINLDSFSSVEDKDIAKESIGILPDELVIGVKGPVPRYILESFSMLKESNSHLKLLVLGEKEEVDDRDIMFYSPNYSLEKYFQSIDMYIGPMSYLSLLAMSCEVVVLTDSSGMFGHIIEDKKHALKYPSKNSVVLRVKLQWLIHAPTEREAIAFRARSAVQQFLKQ